MVYERIIPIYKPTSNSGGRRMLWYMKILPNQAQNASDKKTVISRGKPSSRAVNLRPLSSIPNDLVVQE